jgi:hypothetical protein
VKEICAGAGYENCVYNKHMRYEVDYNITFYYVDVKLCHNAYIRFELTFQICTDVDSKNIYFSFK